MPAKKSLFITDDGKNVLLTFVLLYSRGFIVPAFCFAFVAYYGFCWPALSRARAGQENNPAAAAIH